MLKCESPKDLKELDLPAILFRPHFKNQVGHFLVLLDVRDDQHLRVIDGTTGKERELDLEYLKRMNVWTGTVLVPARGRFDGERALSLTLVGLIGLAIACSFGNWPWSGVRSRRSTPARAAQLMSLIVALGTMFSQRCTAGELPGQWRSAENAPANALALLMTIHGRTVDYDALAAAFRENPGFPKVSFADVARIARGLDFPVTLLSVSPDELVRCRHGIVLLKPARSQDGGFCLFVPSAGEPDSIDVVTGSFVTWNRLDRDSFFDDWSGHILLHTPESRLLPFVRGFGWSTGLTASVVLVWWRWRRGESSQRNPRPASARGECQ